MILPRAQEQIARLLKLKTHKSHEVNQEVKRAKLQNSPPTSPTSAPDLCPKCGGVMERESYTCYFPGRPQKFRVTMYVCSHVQYYGPFKRRQIICSLSKKVEVDPS